eukprot:PITA_06883
MSNYEREASNRPPIFDGTNFNYWKVRVIAYLQSLGTEVWDIIETCYTFPLATPTDAAEKKKYETNAKAVNTLLGCLSQTEFVKVMQYKSAKEIWYKIVLSYEGDEQVKRAKLQTLRIQYENLRMYNDESVANYFLRVDEIVNCMKNFGEEIKEAIVVEKVLRSLSPKFESKVSAIVEEKENLRILTMSQLHGILTAYEMRREVHQIEEKLLSRHQAKEIIMKQATSQKKRKKNQTLSEIFKGVLEGSEDKGKEPARWNKKQSASKKRYYTHEDSDGLSNSDEDERGNEYKLLMAFEDDDYMDAIDLDYFHEEITKLKRCIEEKNMIIDTLQFQIDEKERHLEKLEGEIVGLRKEIEKTKAINLKFVKGSETLDEIINVQRPPLNKTGLGYNGETSQASTSKSYLDAARRNEQKHNEDHQVKQGRIANRNYQGQSILRVNKSYNQPQVKYSQFGSRIDDKRNYNQLAGRFDNRRSFFNGQCFSCHNFGHKAAQCVAYKKIMTREAQKQRSMTGITKRTYNNFSVLENEVECSICNNFGHEDSECRSRF